MAEARDDRQEFGFTPDWRAQIPFALMPFVLALAVGLPAYVARRMMAYVDPVSLVILGGLVMFAGVHKFLIFARAQGQYRRKVQTGAIEVDGAGIRLPLPADRWVRVHWDEVRELRVIRAGGLLGEGLIRVLIVGPPVTIPGYVNDREELLLQIRKRARLTEARRGWWATVWRRG